MARAQPFEVRKSRVHGRGAFAIRRIRRGSRVAEYTGPRISTEEADERYDNNTDGRTYLFIVDKRTVIDATNEGGDARFINHSCEPNCDTELDGKRVFIYANKTIEAGEELSYDYQLQMEGTDAAGFAAHYACRCGAPSCRGTMLLLPKRRRRAVAARSTKA